MKILLINLCIRPDTPKKIYPVGLGYIASSIHRAGHDLKIVDADLHRYSDEEFKNILKKSDFDAVGFGCVVTGYKVVKNVCSIVRSVNKKAKIIVGNSVATSIPRILLEKTDADIAIMGEGDVTIAELLDALEKNRPLQSVEGIRFKQGGSVIATKTRKPIQDINNISFPEWDLFEMGLYIKESRNYVSEPYPIPKDNIKAVPVNTARGCIYKCTFCYHVFRDNKYRFRSPASITKEIVEAKRRYGINYVNFWDELTLYSKKQAEDLADEIIEEDLGIFWTAACRADLFNDGGDLRLVQKLKRSGCVGLGYSLESANRKILKSMNKLINADDFVMQKSLLDRAGITTWTSLVFGYPEETEDTVKETMELCYMHNIYPSAGFLLPQPGTEIYRYCIDKGIIRDEEEYLLGLGDRQDLRINLTNIPSGRLIALVKEYLEKINKKMGLNLKDETLLKTGHYKGQQPI